MPNHSIENSFNFVLSSIGVFCLFGALPLSGASGSENDEKQGEKKLCNV